MRYKRIAEREEAVFRDMGDSCTAGDGSGF